MNIMRRMNPIKAHFYVTYLELYEFGTPLQIRMYDIKLYDMELPEKIRRMAYEAKNKAKYCPNRIETLRKMYALAYVDGYPVKPDKVSQMLYWEQLDLYKKEAAVANVRLFASVKEHQAETIIHERRR